MVGLSCVSWSAVPQSCCRGLVADCRVPPRVTICRPPLLLCKRRRMETFQNPTLSLLIDTSSRSGHSFAFWYVGLMSHLGGLRLRPVRPPFFFFACLGFLGHAGYCVKLTVCLYPPACPASQAVDIDTEAVIGAIVCKLDTRPRPLRPARLPSPTYVSRRPIVFPIVPGGPPSPAPLPPPPETAPYLRGYIAMLAVATSHRRSGTGTALAARAMEAMVDAGAAEAVLEAEACNERALGLYENLGFMRTKRLEGYYLNGSDAFRLVARLPMRSSGSLAPL